MPMIKRITGQDGNLLGFNIDGKILRRDTVMQESKSLRSLANGVMDLLMSTSDVDRTSNGAKELIEADQQGIAEYSKPLI